MNFLFLPVNQKSNPWNFAPETLNKTCTLDPPEANWWIRVVPFVAVRYVAGSTAQEAHWPNPVPLHVPTFTLDPSLCLESCLLPLCPDHLSLNCFTGNTILWQRALRDNWWKVFNFILFCFVPTFPFFNFVAPSTPARLSTVSCCIIPRFCLTLECLFFSFSPPFLVLYSGSAAEPSVN